MEAFKDNLPIVCNGFNVSDDFAMKVVHDNKDPLIHYTVE